MCDTYAVAFLKDGYYTPPLTPDGLPLYRGSYGEMAMMLWCGFEHDALTNQARVVRWSPTAPQVPLRDTMSL